jgi:hypothetical protein
LGCFIVLGFLKKIVAFSLAKKPRIASNVNTTSNNKSSSIELNPALSNSKAAQKDNCFGFS